MPRSLTNCGVVILSCLSAAAQTTSPQTETEMLPEISAHVQLKSNVRLLSFVGWEEGIGYPYQQVYGAAALGYQFKPILRPHLRNIDPDKEHYLNLGGGYEFLQTTHSGKQSHEDRIVLEATPGFRFPFQLLARDRNWLELRWVDGAYSATYRNMLTVERDVLVGSIRFNPYGSAETFYDGASSSWNEQWYTGGVMFPVKNLVMIEAFYRRENCVTCTPPYWNAGGVTLNFYFRNKR